MWSRVDASPADAVRRAVVDNAQQPPLHKFILATTPALIRIVFFVKVGLVDIFEYDILALQ